MLKYSKRRSIAVVLVIVSIVSLVFAAYLGVKTTRLWEETPPHRIRETNVTAIESWMTLGYVSRAYGVPPNELHTALHLETKEFERASIKKIAAQTNQNENELLEQVRKIVNDFQSAHPTPPIR